MTDQNISDVGTVAAPENLSPENARAAHRATGSKDAPATSGGGGGGGGGAPPPPPPPAPDSGPG